MFSLADGSAVALRALSFVAVVQAAGAAMFLSLHRDDLQACVSQVRRICRASAAAAFVLATLAQIVAPVRLVGDFSGIFDATLQSLMLASDAGAATSVRLVGLALVLIGATGDGRQRPVLAPIGATLIAVSFAFMGHTASNAGRWYLAVFLVAHVLIAAFWFGSLRPLVQVVRGEQRRSAAVVVENFSRQAVWLVPIIALAGVALAAALLPSWAALRAPYGLLLLVKVFAFAALMGLASLNKWRFGPGIAQGDARAIAAFDRVVRLEWWIIAAVLVVTAVMTSFYSPDSG